MTRSIAENKAAGRIKKIFVKYFLIIQFMYVRRYNQIVTYIVLEKLKEDDSSKQKRFKLTLTITQLNLLASILLFILYGILCRNESYNW